MTKVKQLLRRAKRSLPKPMRKACLCCRKKIRKIKKRRKEKMPAKKPPVKKPGVKSEVKRTVNRLPPVERITMSKVTIIDRKGVQRVMEVHKLPPEVRKFVYKTQGKVPVDLRKITLTEEERKKLMEEWTWD